MRKCSSLDWSFFVLTESQKVTYSEHLTSLVSSDRPFASNCAVLYLFICIYDRVSIVQLDNYIICWLPQKPSPSISRHHLTWTKSLQKVLKTCRSSSCLHLKTWILSRIFLRFRVRFWTAGSMKSGLLEGCWWERGRCHIEVGLGQLLNTKKIEIKRWSRKNNTLVFHGISCWHVDTALRLSVVFSCK